MSSSSVARSVGESTCADRRRKDTHLRALIRGLHPQRIYLGWSDDLEDRSLADDLASAHAPPPSRSSISGQQLGSSRFTTDGAGYAAMRSDGKAWPDHVHGLAGPVSLAGSVSRSSGWRLEKADQLTDGVVAMLWMAKRKLVVDFVLIAASRARLRQVSGSLEIPDQLCGRSFRHADGLRDVPEASSRVGGDAHQHVCVVGDEPPNMVIITGNIVHEK